MIGVIMVRRRILGMGGERAHVAEHGPRDHADRESGAQQKTGTEFHSWILKSGCTAEGGAAEV
jgi:hypothetical protein